MTIAVLADAELRREFDQRTFPAGVDVVHVDSVRALGIVEAHTYFDLQFEFDRERIAMLRKLLPRPVVVNSVVHTCREIGPGFIRINAWPTMLGRSTAEVCADSASSPIAQELFSSLGWQCEIVADVPGMVTPRIIAGIINEAGFALDEGISSAEEIDQAMKLGTNYPFGPFEWLDRIGRGRVADLLSALGAHDERYTSAPLSKRSAP